MIGKSYGNLTVIGHGERSKSKQATLRCKCKCGRIWDASAYYIVRGEITQCWPCANEAFRQRLTTHGNTKTPGFRVWKEMIGRCTRITHKQYADYGGRGIKVCERWMGHAGLANFMSDMGPRPSQKHSIDRIDNDGDYCPENSRWATPAEQARNRRTNRWTEVNGARMCASDLARLCGKNHRTVLRWMDKGWTGDEIYAHFA